MEMSMSDEWITLYFYFHCWAFLLRLGFFFLSLSTTCSTFWKCSSLCFDTTASNTGHLTAACVAIQEKLGRALLWCACRHHIGEIVLDHAFEDLKIEASKSPEVSLFQRLKKNWDRLPHKDISSANIDLSGYSAEAQSLLQELKQDHLNPIVKRETNLRDDYKEMAQLSLFILNNEEKIYLKRPGAMHKARWMAKILYSIKICLLKDYINELPKGTVTTPHQLAQLHEFVVFIIFVYSGWWLQCRSAINTPWLDLCLYKSLLRYEIVNKTIAKSAQRALARHLWYLTPELAFLSIFSEAVPSEEREVPCSKTAWCEACVITRSSNKQIWDQIWKTQISRNIQNNQIIRSHQWRQLVCNPYSQFECWLSLWKCLHLVKKWGFLEQ